MIIYNRTKYKELTLKSYQKRREDFKLNFKVAGMGHSIWEKVSYCV